MRVLHLSFLLHIFCYLSFKLFISTILWIPSINCFAHYVLLCLSPPKPLNLISPLFYRSLPYCFALRTVRNPSVVFALATHPLTKNWKIHLTASHVWCYVGVSRVSALYSGPAPCPLYVQLFWEERDSLQTGLSHTLTHSHTPPSQVLGHLPTQTLSLFLSLVRARASARSILYHDFE